jgi:cysteinyl-tRNA synthetase
MIAGARVEVASYKKDPADFVLWKPSQADVIGWDSPWGRGRPGWHIECSAMIERHLGRTIDIHGGGLDLIFPHHENEIAQSRCAHGGAPLARYWVHNGFLSMAGSEKMSKSLGNVVTVGELLEQGHKGEVLRFALLSAHYRQPLEWSEALVTQSKATLDRLYGRLKQHQFIEDDELNPADCDPGVVDALSDDLNTPLALARLGGLTDAKTLTASGMLLGLFSRRERWPNFFLDLDSGEKERVDRLVEVRAEAKKRRDFTEADRIREELAAEGILLEDGPAGTTWRRS